MTHPARLAATASMDAVRRRSKADWLALFADDAVLEDPIGPSMFDPAGLGHHGREAIAAFWDKAIALPERFEFDIVDSFAAGSEVANVGTISAYFTGGTRVDTEGVFVYRVNSAGLIVSLRAFWETDRTMATLRHRSRHR
jgi:steroid Delta-isomerase